MNWNNLDEVKTLKSNMHATFDSPQGKEVIRFLRDIGGWYPTVFDSNETNDIIGRDANRKLLGTIRTILELSAEQLVILQTEK